MTTPPECLVLPDGFADALRGSAGIGHDRKLRLSYISLASDVAEVQQHWVKGEQDPKSLRATYAAMFIELVEKLDAEGLIFSRLDTPSVPGHAVQIATVENKDAGYFDPDLRAELEAHIARFQPDFLIVSPSVSPDMIAAVSVHCPTLFYLPSLFWPIEWDAPSATLTERARRFVRSFRSKRQLTGVQGAIWEVGCVLKQTPRTLPRDVLEAKAVPQFYAPVTPRVRTQARKALFVGTFWDANGIFFLIEAFKPVAKKYPDARLIVVGDGTERAAVEDMAAALPWLDLRLGYSAERQLEAVHEADLLVVPDLAQSIKASVEFLPEALVQGLPALISSSVAATDEERACCAEFQAGDMAGLSEQLDRLWGDDAAFQALAAKGPLDPAPYFDRSQSWGSAIAKLLAKIAGINV